jgi:hypothetical protein
VLQSLGSLQPKAQQREVLFNSRSQEEVKINVKRTWGDRSAIYHCRWGIQNGADILGDCFAVSYKTKHTLTTCSSNHVSWYLPKEVENLCLHKNLHMDVYNNFIHDDQNVETSRISLSRRMNNKVWYIQIMEILFSPQKK